MRLPDLLVTAAIPNPMVNAQPKSRFNNMIGVVKQQARTQKQSDCT